MSPLLSGSSLGDHLIMNTRYISLSIILSLMSVSECRDSKVSGIVGQTVTLPCKYAASSYGGLHICWGKGELPSSGCNEELIMTDGHKVTRRASQRYQVLGDLLKGDVSLSILNPDERDSGRYGCRVEIPGLFNDKKSYVHLTIERAPSSTVMSSSSTGDDVTATPQSRANHTRGHMITNHTELQETSTLAFQKSSIRGYLIGILLTIVCLLAGGIVAIVLLRRKRKMTDAMNQTPRQSVIYSSPGGHVHLPPHHVAVENIYQLDESGLYDCIQYNGQTAR